MPPFRLADVRQVEFYKRDELTADLICCEISLLAHGKSRQVIFAHEEMPYWGALIHRLELLAGFDAEWFSPVSKPAYLECGYEAFTSTI